MKHSKIRLFNALLLIICCLVFGCIKQSTGPTTTIHGVVTDAATGQPIANLQMQVLSQYDNPANNTSRLKVTTAADGSYSLKFNIGGIAGAEKYYLRPASAVLNRFYETDFPQVTLAADNKLDIKAYQLVNVSIHLINQSTENRDAFFLEFDGSVYGYTFGLNSPKSDTVLQANLVRNTTYSVKSLYFNDKTTSPAADQIIFTKQIYVGKVDTALVVKNK